MVLPPTVLSLWFQNSSPAAFKQQLNNLHGNRRSIPHQELSTFLT